MNFSVCKNTKRFIFSAPKESSQTSGQDTGKEKEENRDLLDKIEKEIQEKFEKEYQQRLEEDRKRLEEFQAKLEHERKIAEAEYQRKLEDEYQAKIEQIEEESRKRAEEEAQKRAEESQKRAEEERTKLALKQLRRRAEQRRIEETREQVEQLVAASGGTVEALPLHENSWEGLHTKISQLVTGNVAKVGILGVTVFLVILPVAFSSTLWDQLRSLFARCGWIKDALTFPLTYLTGRYLEK